MTRPKSPPVPSAPLMKVRDAAETYGCHPVTIRRAIADGRLRAFRVGRNIRLRPEDLAAWAAPVPAVVREATA